MLVRSRVKTMFWILIAALAACTSHPELETTIEVPTSISRPRLETTIEAANLDSRFSDLKVISPATAARVTQLMRRGKGLLTSSYAWAQKVPLLAIVTEAGISIYDATARREVRFIETPGTMASVALSPDGQILAAGGEHNSLVLMNVTTGDLLYTLQASSRSQPSAHTSQRARELAFTPSGQRLAAAEEKMIKLWDLETGRLLASHEIPDYPDRIEFANEQVLVVQWSGVFIKLWNTITGQTWTPPDRSVLNWNFQPNGTLVTLDKDDQTVNWWDAVTFQKKSSLPLKTGLDRVIFGASSTDGKIVAIQSLGALEIWDSSTGRLRYSIGKLGMRGAVFSPDDKALAWVDESHVVNVWDVATGGRELNQRLVSDARFAGWVSFAPDHKTLAVIYTIDTGPHAQKLVFKIWDVATGQTLVTFDEISRIEQIAFPGYSSTPISKSSNDVLLSPDGTIVISRPVGGTALDVWETTTGRLRSTLDPAVHSDGKALSQDGRLLAVLIPEGLQLWDTLSGKVLAVLPENNVTAAAFTPDGRTIASLDNTGTLKLWEVATGHLRSSGGVSTRFVRDMTFSPDGRLLALASSNKTVHLWDVLAEKERSALTGHLGAVTSVAFSPTGQILASGGDDDDRTIKLWEVADGRELATLRGGTLKVTDVAFSKDGKYLASSSYDGTIRVWGVP
ncbi:putative serine/threonine-protein kinase PkwA [Thermoflexales bacterium]|nr:putative serine/threonine-protein kinase PkwA [Thermoflexales bacterium]